MNNIAENITSSTLYKILSTVSSSTVAKTLLNSVEVSTALLCQNGEQVSRAEIAQALNMMLFNDLLERTPEARLYVADKLESNRKIFLDHGSIHTVTGISTGQLPSGKLAFTRILEPLGFYKKSTYELDDINMTGYAYCHIDYPQQIGQFFVSELDATKFSKAFHHTSTKVLSSSIDPLDQQASTLLEKLEKNKYLSLSESCKLLKTLLSCFSRQHKIPLLEDYKVLAKESYEMAWIATEGHTYNHITDRVDNVLTVSEEQKQRGRPIKENIEISTIGSIRQTAYKPTIIKREFMNSAGKKVNKKLPGSFIEFIDRAFIVEFIGQTFIEKDHRNILDLRFDVSNTQNIFKMARTIA